MTHMTLKHGAQRKALQAYNYAFFIEASSSDFEKHKKINAQVYNKKVIGSVWRYVLWGLIVLA